MKYLLTSVLFFSKFLFAGQHDYLNDLDKIMGSFQSSNPLKWQDGKVIFDYKGTLGSFDRSSAAGDNRYFLVKEAQRGGALVMGYRFAESVSQKDIKGKTAQPLSLAQFSNRSKIFRSSFFEFGANSQPIIYQECWQKDFKEPELGCALVNKDICLRANKSSEFWNNEFRGLLATHFDDMQKRYEREKLPDDISDKRGMGLMKIKVSNGFKKSQGDIYSEVPPDIISRFKVACSRIFAIESAEELTIKNH